MIISALSLTASVALMVLFVARRADGVQMAYAHMCIAALVAVGFAVAFFKQNSELRTAKASQSAIAANTARYVGYVWCWGAACLLTVYATGLLQWREWLHFSLACVVLAGACLAFAGMLQKDANAGKEDAAMLKLAHRLAILLLAGMVIAIVGFLIDGKMTRFLNPRFTDWPANNVFFFGAVSIAAIAGYALKHKTA